jgi:hypothetical protein
MSVQVSWWIIEPLPRKSSTFIPGLARNLSHLASQKIVIQGSPLCLTQPLLVDQRLTSVLRQSCWMDRFSAVNQLPVRLFVGLGSFDAPRLHPDLNLCSSLNRQDLEYIDVDAPLWNLLTCLPLPAYRIHASSLPTSHDPTGFLEISKLMPSPASF